ncbi:uncharacterized protein BDW43DRAFT_275727 [Aspergillus alliaceus]|uniref:uncharacterized protein n=1 Tax=Petromyces alliaceus TaxID=209559 RepID=UPI0012A43234|nr:uncharacterized protein BDW43DRAFT_275727 [Aspergillus alliaceus]KAB8233647.1 hypothetical protein BDW43DRAFT_275727 [Aspergillus alliaceus]
MFSAVRHPIRLGAVLSSPLKRVSVERYLPFVQETPTVTVPRGSKVGHDSTRHPTPCHSGPSGQMDKGVAPIMQGSWNYVYVS